MPIAVFLLIYLVYLREKYLKVVQYLFISKYEIISEGVHGGAV